jgi:hypothetical protein
MLASNLAWGKIEKMCPKGREMYEPSPVKDIEELFCKFASQKQIEDKAIDEVCSIIEQKFPSVNGGECTIAAKLAWDKIVKMCPKGREMYKFSPVKDIEELVCKVASQKQIDGKAIDEVCSIIEQKFPSIKRGECMIAAKLAWGKIEKMCPKGREMYEPSPVKDIEELFCKVASQKQIEDKAIDEVSTTIEQKVPMVKKDACMLASNLAWGKIEKMCPKGREMYNFSPVNDIEKLVCKVASQKQIEDRAIDEVCSIIEEKFPSVKKGECMIAAKLSWDKIEKMCPKGREIYEPNPAKDIEELVCKVASQKQIEDRAIDEVCSMIEEKFRRISKAL